MGRDDNQGGKGQGNGQARGGGRDESRAGRDRRESGSQGRNGDEEQPADTNDYGAFDTTGDDAEQIGDS